MIMMDSNAMMMAFLLLAFLRAGSGSDSCEMLGNSLMDKYQ
jgi:hypothetical protein